MASSTFGYMVNLFCEMKMNIEVNFSQNFIPSLSSNGRSSSAAVSSLSSWELSMSTSSLVSKRKHV